MFLSKKVLAAVLIVLSVGCIGCAQQKYGTYAPRSQFGNDASFLSDNYQADNISLDLLKPSEDVVSLESTQSQNMSDMLFSGNDDQNDLMTVVKRGDGTFTVLEGNETLSRLKKSDVKTASVKVSYPFSKDVYSTEDLRQKNEASRSDFNAIAQQIHSKVGGELRLQSVYGNYQNVQEKVNKANGDPKRVTDILVGRIVFEEKSDVLDAIKYVNKRQELIAILDRWNATTEFDEMEAVCYIRTHSGILGELKFSLAVMEDYKAYLYKLSEFQGKHKDSKFAKINARLRKLKINFRNRIANDEGERLKPVYTDLMSLANEMCRATNILLIEGLVEQQEDFLNNL